MCCGLEEIVSGFGETARIACRMAGESGVFSKCSQVASGFSARFGSRTVGIKSIRFATRAPCKSHEIGARWGCEELAISASHYYQHAIQAAGANWVARIAAARA